MENQLLDFEQKNEPKARHGCVTAWLVLMIVANSMTALAYLFMSETMLEAMPDASMSMLMLLGIIGIANIVFAVLLFQWKKLGFWGFVGTSILTVGTNLSIGLGIGQSLAGLVGIGILYAILQIKENNKTAWEQLD